MESSASPPSVASSHATQTGRPSLWSDSDQRKLVRLYVYTTLPIKKILNVIQATSPDGDAGPGKDSANKKLNAMLDKEPRWLHPRNRTDMERRMKALATSPTRSMKQEFPSPIKQSAATSPAALPVDLPHHQSVPGAADDEGAGAGSSTTTFAHPDPDLAAFVAVPPRDPGNYDYYPHHDHDRHHPQQGQQGQHMGTSPTSYANQLVDEPMADAEHDAAHHTQHHAPQRRLHPRLRRSTAMTASTDRTTATLRRALSDYSSGFVTHVKRVIKRYTMPTQATSPGNPRSHHPPTGPYSARGSWVHDDEHAAPEMTCAPPLPGEFLVLDMMLSQHGPCSPGCFEHETKTCLCRVADAVSDSLWMTGPGLSPHAARLLVPGAAQPADFGPCDAFGNSLMHLLAARDADHAYILALVAQGVSCRQRNSAGQTFLHLLDPSWLADDSDGGSSRGLITLLRAFEPDPAFFLARDCYGRTLFHALHSKIRGLSRFAHLLAPFDHVLRTFEPALSRDAFGDAPAPCKADNLSVKPIRRAHTSMTPHNDDDDYNNNGLLAAPGPSPFAQPEPDLVTSQARLLQFVSRCQDNPALEDAHGRNGLHCLAAAILSDSSLLQLAAPAPPPAPPSSARKRKRDGPAGPPGSTRPSDSSRDRLALRETIAHNLLAAGVNPNAYDASGTTPLMAFAALLPEDDDYKLPVSILQRLAEAGAAVDARNRRGETALHVAVRRGRKLAMRTLAQAGANVHVRDAAGRSLLGVADERMGAEGGGGKAYMHYEACRAWLSGQEMAVQEPGVLEEWVMVKGR